MPLAIMLLLLVVGIGAGLFTGIHSSDQSQDLRLANAMAQQMSWYHMAAVKQCSAPATCSAGEITVASLPTNAGGSFGYATSFVSGTDGKMVVTTWLPANRLAGSGYGLAGLVGTALRSQSYYSLYAGNWTLATGTIQSTSQYSYSDGTSGTSSVSVAQNFGGLSLTDGAPILATVLHDSTTGGGG